MMRLVTHVDTSVRLWCIQTCKSTVPAGRAPGRFVQYTVGGTTRARYDPSMPLHQG